MYLEHYGLTEAPFRITPDPGFFFTGAKRGATLDALLYSVTHDEGIVKVSGEVGCGKTMVCRMLMQRLPSHVLPIYLANPALSREDILHSIAEELQVVTASVRPSAILRSLQDRLTKLRSEGKQVVLLIDEAHALSIETLEEICILSNLEFEHHNLLQLVLFGQPELNRLLARSDMRQLKERITHHFALEPLSLADIAVYLNFRMRAAGYRGPSLFTPSAVKLIAGVSLGLTRRINVLADKSLLAAYSENTHQVARRQVRSAIRDSEFDNRRASRAWLGSRSMRLILGGAALLLALSAVSLSALWTKPRSNPADLAQASATLPAALAESAPPLDAPIQPPAPPPAELLARSSSAPTPAPAVVAAAAAPTAPAIGAPKGRGSKFGAQTTERITATSKWLDSATEDRWFIQLLATEARSADKIESFVSDTIALVGPEQVRVYVAEVQGNQRVGIIYGDYPSREAALTAMAQLPGPLLSHKPFPRKVKWLR